MLIQTNISPWTHQVLSNRDPGNIVADICIFVEYPNDTSIETFVLETAASTNRNKDKALEWVRKLQNQDIMTVGDLRDLHDEDWAGIGLTVFALRALKNMLVGKKHQQRSRATSSGTNTPIEEQDQYL